MSLRSEPIPDVPEETVRIARAAFPKGNLYVKMRDELGTFYDSWATGFFAVAIGSDYGDAVCRRTFRPAGGRSCQVSN